MLEPSISPAPCCPWWDSSVISGCGGHAGRYQFERGDGEIKVFELLLSSTGSFIGVRWGFSKPAYVWQVCGRWCWGPEHPGGGSPRHRWSRSRHAGPRGQPSSSVTRPAPPCQTPPAQNSGSCLTSSLSEQRRTKWLNSDYNFLWGQVAHGVCSVWPEKSNLNAQWDLRTVWKLLLEFNHNTLQSLILNASQHVSLLLFKCLTVLHCCKAIKPFILMLPPQWSKNGGAKQPNLFIF